MGPLGTYLHKAAAILLLLNETAKTKTDYFILEFAFSSLIFVHGSAKVDRSQSAAGKFFANCRQNGAQDGLHDTSLN